MFSQVKYKWIFANKRDQVPLKRRLVEKVAAKPTVIEYANELL